MKALDLAKYILKNSGKDYSNLELQKILYFVNLAYVRDTGKFLIDEDFEAWKFGAVISDVYLEYKNYGASSIALPPDDIKLNISSGEKEIVDNAIKECGKQSYWQLVEKSHKKGGAWDKSYEENKRNKIDRALIIESSKEL